MSHRQLVASGEQAPAMHQVGDRQLPSPAAKVSAPTDADLLSQVSCRLGDSSCASADASTLQRATSRSVRSFAPNARTADSLLRLQRQYGNRFIQRVLHVARKVNGEAEATPDLEAAIQRERGGGRALDSDVRVQMESSFGADFGGVRIHTGNQADSLNRDLSARAFTTGQNIFFRQGEYCPGSSSGRELLAHELTHVVQRTGGVHTKLTIGATGDRFEQEADAVAREVIQQESRPQQHITSQSVQRQMETDEDSEEMLSTKPENAQIQRQFEELKAEDEMPKVQTNPTSDRSNTRITAAPSQRPSIQRLCPKCEEEINRKQLPTVSKFTSAFRIQRLCSKCRQIPHGQEGQKAAVVLRRQRVFDEADQAEEMMSGSQRIQVLARDIVSGAFVESASLVSRLQGFTPDELRELLQVVDFEASQLTSTDPQRDELIGAAKDEIRNAIRGRTVVLPRCNQSFPVPSPAAFREDPDLQAVRVGSLILERGQSSTATRLVQEAMRSYGCAKLGLDLLPRFGADGSFGNETHRAAWMLQRHEGFATDGDVGPVTLGALDMHVGVVTEDEVDVVDGDAATEICGGWQSFVQNMLGLEQTTFNDAVTCLCFAGGLLDLVDANPILAPAALWIEWADCSCNSVTFLQTLWKFGTDGGCWSWSNYSVDDVAKLVLLFGTTVADCTSLPVGAAVGALLSGITGAVTGSAAGLGGTAVGGIAGAGIGAAAGDFVVDVSTMALQNWITQDTVWPIAQCKACARLGLPIELCGSGKKPSGTCIPGSGIQNSQCSIYAANSWWLPLAFVQNAQCACQETPNEPTANCVRKFLQDRLTATPTAIKGIAAAHKALENPATYPAYQVFVQSTLTPRIYQDHVDAYASCCCPSGPAQYPAWVGVTSVPLPCAGVGAAIRISGSCHGTPGKW